MQSRSCPRQRPYVPTRPPGEREAHPTSRVALVPLALAFAAALVLPVAPATDQAFVGGVPTVGTSFVVKETISYPPEDPTGFWWATRIAFTGGAQERLDGYHQARMVAPLDVWTILSDSFEFGPSHEFLDLDSRIVVGGDAAPSTGTDSRVGPVRVHQARADPRILHHFTWVAPSLLLQGRALGVGETYMPTGDLGSSTFAGGIVFTGIGWEDGLFHARADYLVDGVLWFSEDYWYEQGAFVPTRGGYTYDWTDENGTHTERYDVTIEDLVQGTGPLVEAAGYVAPTGTSFQGLVPRTTWTIDGPDEDILSTIPLSQAAATARGSPLVADWLARHPDAFVVGGSFQEDPFSGRILWTVRLADGASRMSVPMSAPWVPGQAAGPLVVTGITQSSEPWSLRFASEHVGDEVACMAHAEAVAFEGAPDFGGDDVGSARRGSFSIDASGQSSCEVVVERILNDNTMPGVVGLREEWPFATARVLGASGFVTGEGRGIASQERAIYLDG